MLRFFRNSPSQYSDAELLERYRQGGDKRLLAQLYERYVELVFGVCLKYLKNEADAEDAVMSIYEELVKKVLKHEIRNFRSWLHVLSKNYCLMQLRKRERKQTTYMEPQNMQIVDSRHHTFEFPEGGNSKALKNCINKLSEKQKSCIQLFYFEEKSYKEIAVLKKESVGKVRSYLQNGRRNLKICLEMKQK